MARTDSSQPNPATQPTIKRFSQLKQELGLSRSTISRMVQSGDFPKPVKISPQSIGWFSDEVENWLKNRVRAG